MGAENLAKIFTNAMTRFAYFSLQSIVSGFLVDFPQDVRNCADAIVGARYALMTLFPLLLCYHAPCELQVSLLQNVITINTTDVAVTLL